jgi:hypothetical protein
MYNRHEHVEGEQQRGRAEQRPEHEQDRTHALGERRQETPGDRREVNPVPIAGRPLPMWAAVILP